ncbi:uncharacterized protein LOC111641391 isoform X3 [Centruroides sculpturatus]|uniref:uncharacterized protein LOC111641391 isoform X3 n=1 Tax=Centruroides sculpturatus TaxID=218467 RepID=UPI000C6D7B4B|nr:uncharacterized protein LOC111641391 isoform X3 [Centruroides sculpturatus]
MKTIFISFLFVIILLINPSLGDEEDSNRGGSYRLRGREDDEDSRTVYRGGSYRLRGREDDEDSRTVYRGGSYRLRGREDDEDSRTVYRGGSYRLRGRDVEEPFVVSKNAYVTGGGRASDKISKRATPNFIRLG